jgi:iron(III) transport system permease protein
VRASLTLAGAAAVVTVGAAVLLGYRQRIAPGARAAAAVSLARIGYAVPGGVIAVGLLVPFAALGAWEGGQATLSPNMDAAARVLGQTPLGMLRRVHVPVLSPSILTALLIVFVDVMKELPATLIMRPFGWDTLAVQAYRLASDERLGGAAVPSLTIVAVAFVPVVLLVRRIGRGA